MTTARGTIHLVRHAHALARTGWRGDDGLRPLSERGIAQARALATGVTPPGAFVLVSSPAVRCQSTLRPLAERLAAGIELLDALAEGRSGGHCLDLLLTRLAGTEAVVACTHGDVLGEALDVLEALGTPFSSPRALPKAGTWVLTVNGGHIVEARLRPPPRVSA